MAPSPLDIRALLFTLLFLIPGTSLAQAGSDVAAVRQAALDYIEGWYYGDGDRMERALHPELAKRIARPGAEGSRLEQMSAPDLGAMTRRGGGSATPPEQQRMDVSVLDVFGDVAAVRVDPGAWIDYLQLARVDGAWKIVNVLWEERP